MKKSKQLFFASILILFTCFSCKEGSEKKDVKIDASKVSIDTPVIDQPIVQEKKLTPSDIQVKIFSEVPKYVDEDGVSHKTSYYEKKDVMKNNDKTYFCGELENFSKIEIFGNGKNISFTINFENQTIFEKKDIEIKDKIKFTKGDFDLFNLGIYTILVKQGDNLLFKKEIEFTTCD